MSLQIRAATAADVPRITEIYNHWITETHVSFDDEPHTIDERMAWFAKYGEAGRYRAFVGELDDLVVGVSYSSRFRPKSGYDTTVETTVVVHPDALGLGIGRRLLTHLIEVLEHEDVHRAVALIAVPNEPSIVVHEELGYDRVGVYSEVGRKFGRYWSVQIMERKF